MFDKYDLRPASSRSTTAMCARRAVDRNSDVGATTELAASRAGTRAASSMCRRISSIQGKQIGLAATRRHQEAGRPDRPDVAYPRATGGHLYFVRYLKKYKLPADNDQGEVLQAPEMVAALERRDIDAFFLWSRWLDKAGQLVQGAARAGALGRRRRLHPHVLQLLFAGAGRRQAARRGRRPGREWTPPNSAPAVPTRRRASPARRSASRKRNEALHECMKYRMEAEGRWWLGNFQAAPSSPWERASFKEDAGLERLRAPAVS